MMTSREPEAKARYAHIHESFHRIFRERFDFEVSSARETKGEYVQTASVVSSSPNERRTLIGISITNTMSKKSVPIEFTGSGLAEVLYLLTLVTELKDRVVCLDEPASHVHPSTQRQILEEVAKLSGDNQVFMITHSPYLLSSRFLSQTIRFYLKGESTRWCRMPTALEKEIQAEKLVERSPTLLAALFSDKVVLFEGEYEQAALMVWFRTYGANPGILDDDLAFVAVNGQKSFPSYHRFLSSWELDCFAIGDNKASAYTEDFPHHFMLKEEDFSELLEEHCKEEFTKARGLFPGRQSGKNPQIARYVAENAFPPPEILELCKEVAEFAKLPQE
jgi:predicted ATP-dependent endonuclease of OLD family